MTDRPNPSDQEMLEMLKDALEDSVSPSPDAIDMLMTGYDIVQADSVDAQLTFDSLTSAGVRAEPGAPRHLRFEADSVVIECDIVDVELRCLGTVSPAGGQLTVEQLEGPTPVAVADTGSFEVVVEGTGPFRFRYELEDLIITTSWLRFGGLQP